MVHLSKLVQSGEVKQLELGNFISSNCQQKHFTHWPSDHCSSLINPFLSSFLFPFSPDIETSQRIRMVNELTGFYNE